MSSLINICDHVPCRQFHKHFKSFRTNPERTKLYMTVVAGLALEEISLEYCPFCGTHISSIVLARSGLPIRRRQYTIALAKKQDL